MHLLGPPRTTQSNAWSLAWLYPLAPQVACLLGQTWDSQVIENLGPWGNICSPQAKTWQRRDFLPQWVSRGPVPEFLGRDKYVHLLVTIVPTSSYLDLSSPQEGLTWQPHLSAAKSLQSCLTLCDPIDGSPPGSPIPGILQARTLEWVAISFSNVGKCKVNVKSLSRVRLLATPWTAAYQAPPSMGFSRQEYWSGVPLWAHHNPRAGPQCDVLVSRDTGPTFQGCAHLSQVPVKKRGFPGGSDG